MKVGRTRLSYADISTTSVYEVPSVRLGRNGEREYHSLDVNIRMLVMGMKGIDGV